MASEKDFDEWFAGLPSREGDGGTSLLFLDKAVEEENPSAVERAITSLTDTVKALAQRQSEPAPAPNITVEVYPQIEVQVPETQVSVEFPEHEQVMVVERDEEGFIQTIRKRFTRGGGEDQAQSGGLLNSISKLARQGFGLGPKDED